MRLSRVLLAALACTGLVFAQAATTAAEKPAAAKAPAAKVLKVSGTVESVDAIGNMLIVKVKAATDTFSVNATTKIENSAKAVVALGDLKAGEKVMVHYTVEAGKKVASVVMIEAAAAPAAAPKKAAPAAEPAKAK